MCLINFLGHSVLVSSIVPLGPNTLIYGNPTLIYVNHTKPCSSRHKRWRCDCTGFRSENERDDEKDSNDAQFEGKRRIDQEKKREEEGRNSLIFNKNITITNTNTGS